jgi:hypothetical protein
LFLINLNVLVKSTYSTEMTTVKFLFVSSTKYCTFSQSFYLHLRFISLVPFINSSVENSVLFQWIQLKMWILSMGDDSVWLELSAFRRCCLLPYSRRNRRWLGVTRIISVRRCFLLPYSRRNRRWLEITQIISVSECFLLPYSRRNNCQMDHADNHSTFQFTFSWTAYLMFSGEIVFICAGKKRPPLWSGGQSSWLQIRRPGFDSRHYQKKKVVGLERDSLSLVSTTEELLDRKVAAPV